MNRAKQHAAATKEMYEWITARPKTQWFKNKIRKKQDTKKRTHKVSADGLG